MSDVNKKSQVADAILKQLKNPFDPRLVKFRPGGGKQLAYIDARDVMKRLDDVMGPENWQDEVTETASGVICKLWLRIDGEWLYKSNGANLTKVEALKGGISGAQKRAAVNWGIGRYLYYMPSSCNAKNVGKWPEWAKPNNSVEDWEDVAELEADYESGMDVEEAFEAGAENFANAKEGVANAETSDGLKKLVDGMDPKIQQLLADDINNKIDELTRAEHDNSN